MSIFKRIKNTVTATYVAAGKVQDLGADLNLSPNVNNVREVKQQQQINVVSKKRFYQILEHLEDRHGRKYGADDSLRTFVNKEYYEGHRTIYHIRTDNSLGGYTNYVNVINENGLTVLEFIVNPPSHPTMRTNDITNLRNLTVIENAKTYSYDVLRFLGSDVKSPYETSFFFQVNIVKNGEYDFEMGDDEKRTLTAKDFPPKDTIYL